MRMGETKSAHALRTACIVCISVVTVQATPILTATWGNGDDADPLTNFMTISVTNAASMQSGELLIYVPEGMTAYDDVVMSGNGVNTATSYGQISAFYGDDRESFLYQPWTQGVTNASDGIYLPGESPNPSSQAVMIALNSAAPTNGLVARVGFSGAPADELPDKVLAEIIDEDEQPSYRGVLAVVPEPATTGLLLLGWLGLLARRSRT